MTASVILEYQRRKAECKTIDEYKALGRELRDRYNLTDKEALDILRNERVLEHMANHEEETSNAKTD